MKIAQCILIMLMLGSMGCISFVKAKKTKIEVEILEKSEPERERREQ